ncbi:DUF1802 family protein [Planctomicrobium sp. SH661]|uniref:DUF1802 family protein n=1 Tax=Planctomicrobium sp. SH661 TaxID=3448124 RepID=UPI003F5B34DC
MLKSNQIALKEWAVLCHSLASGDQQILFRKGGIHEGPEGFQPEYKEFWLFPTGFHQSLDGVRPEFRESVMGLKATFTGNVIPIQHYCSIQSVHWIDDEAKLESLVPFHVLTAEAVLQRFHYRRPGIYGLLVRTSTLAKPVEVPVDPRYEGCHSWVELNDSIPTDGVSLEQLENETQREKDLSEILGRL